jgi:hypothetical protein
MKNKTIYMAILTLLMLVIGAGVTASAEALGEKYTISGIQIGWWIICVGAIIAIVALTDIIDKKKFTVLGLAILIIGAIFVIPIETTTEVPPPTGYIIDEEEDCCPFDITGSAVITGANYIASAVWDEETLTFTVPITVSDASDGNLTDHKTGLNLTFDPLCVGATADDIENVHFSTDYLMKYGGEYMLDEDSTGYSAIWTTSEGTEYYDDVMKITADTSGWAQIDYTFVNATSGSWVTELDAIGDSKTWYITASNDCGDWSETITVTLIVVAYTA